MERLLATLVSLRHGATHDVPACWFGVDRSTITRAIDEGLHRRTGPAAAPARRSHRAPRCRRGNRDHRRHRGPGGRPAAGRKDREKFISGKNKQNAVKSMVVTGAGGRLLFCSPAEPASCADITRPARGADRGAAVRPLPQGGHPHATCCCPRRAREPAPGRAP
ncbi:transposase family protein [Streptomyces microflavus]|uniref:helix-turn-helix domain-containing protein n=1 Tax=Streptomyces microflavus TaxID=1919 RepID=UPI0036E85112